MTHHSRGKDLLSRSGRLRVALTSVRLRAALSLGILAAPAGVGTMAFWTDSVAITGSTYTAGTLDMSVTGGDPYATTTLAMGAMVPGSTSAEVLTVENVGTAPLKYSLTGGVTGTDAAALAPDLTLKILAGGTKSGATCTGGTQIYNSALTTTVSTEIITTAAKRGPVAALTGTDPLCFQITFSSGALTGQQGKTASATFTFLGSSDLS